MLLAIDTSGPCCSAALWSLKQDICLVQQSENIGRGHAERLMPMLEELLSNQNAKWADIKKLAVVIGPGSFTGLRVGIATARGLALALGVPCAGVTVFEAFAHFHYAQENNHQPLLVAMDAKRDQIWLQAFGDKCQPVTEPLGVEVGSLAEHIDGSISSVIGSAAKLIVQASGRDIIIINDSPSPPVTAVAAIGATTGTNSISPSPFYLRAPDAKPQKTENQRHLNVSQKTR